jgi:hypothetical protein
MSLLLVSCGLQSSDLVWKEDIVVANALAEVELLKEFHTLYPESKHFISNIARTSPPPKWNSIAGLYGRYVVHIQVPIAVHRKELKITIVGEPLFELREVASIVRTSDGRRDASYGENRTLSMQQWATLVANKGDWSSLGISLRKDAPLADFGDYWAW